MVRADTVIADREAWERVAAAVRERRASLDLTHTDVASKGGVSSNVWSLLENNKQVTYRRRTLVAMARSLRWPDDAILRILDGRAPAEDPGPDASNASAPRPSRPSTRADSETVTVSAGLARRLRDATPDEITRLEAYLDGLFDRRAPET